MSDLWLGVAIMSLLAAGLCVLGWRAARRVSARAASAIALLPTGWAVLHAAVLSEEPRLAWLLPFSNLVVVGNWLPLAVGLLAGLVWSRRSQPRWRRAVVAGVLVAVCLHFSYGRLLGGPPRCADVWDSGVCIQTSRASCSAACAATVLRAQGIEATEREMAALCLTRRWGTTHHGLYRGLKLKTQGTAYDVEVFDWTLEELREKADGPAILLVVLRRGASVDPLYEREWGWVRGQRHAVVFWRFVDDRIVEMGDPSVGREPWTVRSLDVLWHGLGMRLVKR